MWACIRRVEYAEMEIADLTLRAVFLQKILAGHHTVEHPVRARIVPPSQHLRVEFSRGGGIVRSEVDKDERVGIAHGLSAKTETRDGRHHDIVGKYAATGR